MKNKSKFKKGNKIFLLVIITGLLTSCMGIKDVTQSASELLSDVSELTRQIDSKVESGEIEEALGNLIDERLDKLAEIIEATIQNSGGFLFDEANGTIDNIFHNIKGLLDHIQAGLLEGESVPDLITQTSGQLQMYTSQLTTALEDIIILTFGNTTVLVDKTTNNIIVIVSIILLAIGIIIFAVILFKRKGKISGAKLAGLIFMSVYIVFFLLIVFSSRIRGHIIAGFNFGEKVAIREVQPKITGVLPETFVLGKDTRIILYGAHLNKLENISVKLMHGRQVKFTFPDNTLVTNTTNRIILSNFKANLNWVLPRHNELSDFLVSNNISVTNDKLINYSRIITDHIYPKVKRPENTGTSIVLSNVQPVPGMNAGLIEKINYQDIKQVYSNTATTIFGQLMAVRFNSSIVSFFNQKFGLPEGDYGIVAFSDTTKIESAQFISIINPPPPPPKPDIFPVNLAWAFGAKNVAGEKAKVSLTLGFRHPEEIQNPFQVKLSTNPDIGEQSVRVELGDIGNAYSTNLLNIDSREFNLDNPGTVRFNIQSDYGAAISESNEGNNQLYRDLLIKRYVYDVTVKYVSFISRKNKDSSPYPEDEYRITLKTTASGHSDWQFRFDKNGEPNNVYNINKSRTFTSLVPGNRIVLYTSGYEADSGLKDGNDAMGSDSKVISINSNPTSGHDSKDFSYRLNTGQYEVIVQWTIKRKTVL